MQCPQCHTPIRASACSCPSCGVQLKQGRPVLRGLILAAIMIAIVGGTIWFAVIVVHALT